MASDSEIRLGIVGMRLGLWHAGAIAEIDGVSIVAVADNVPGKLPGPNITLQEWADSLGADAYTDGVEMIKNADIDAVDLCVSPKWRVPLVEAAAARGLPVLLEKPWGTNMAHGHAIADIIKQSNLLHMVEFPLRYFPPIVALKALLDDGPLGRPFVVNAEIVMGQRCRQKRPNTGCGIRIMAMAPLTKTLAMFSIRSATCWGTPVSLHAFGASYPRRRAHAARWRRRQYPL